MEHKEIYTQIGQRLRQVRKLLNEKMEAADSGHWDDEIKDCMPPGVNCECELAFVDAKY